MQSVTIVGVGKVGASLAIALSSSGYAVKCLIANDLENAKAFAGTLPDNPVVSNLGGLPGITTDLLFITTQDGSIRAVADEIAALGRAPENNFAYHCSGALSSEELSSLAEMGYSTASVHPLVSISDAEQGNTIFKDKYFAVEGNPNAVNTATELVKAIGGTVFEIESSQKALYHAAAVVACGHFAALFATSVEMLVRCGLDETSAQRIILPLVESTLEGLREKSPEDALTGPFARGDAEIIAGHMAKLAEIADENVSGVYRSLGLVAIELAAKQGVSEQKTAEMRKIILLEKSKTK